MLPEGQFAALFFAFGIKKGIWGRLNESGRKPVGIDYRTADKTMCPLEDGYTAGV